MDPIFQISFVSCRYSSVTICARVHRSSGLKQPLPVPFVTLFSAAQATAAA